MSMQRSSVRSMMFFRVSAGQYHSVYKQKNRISYINAC
ncbi:hypothetical protein PPL_04990 [Heterostelium album PN500]|uniref:Uncharacterized protein n=1 Tax=Heterostelium pallidum (strain ATCC 26659 / Pp 5 / PN500) TaxID=670386 RepID=D3B946_HETP5|nr:hypothetical protein PPL_04990 [Heterostelium album PN500]EFA82085.1 hypothetical protein PPL_04990 [Heterostelium album PN500]|eukprot:XP_020434202.1 hypothetical protein PPL_04990 [Heterostelium album PN500]